VSSAASYLLDTTVLVDVSRNREPAAMWLAEILRRQVDVFVSVVSIAEFYAGVLPRQRTGWEHFFDTLTHVDVTKEIAIRAGILRYDLARQGRVMQLPDALIAATAAASGAALVTANIKDFMVPGLVVIPLLP
jgi:predicted nucleic acid-binding protein